MGMSSKPMITTMIGCIALYAGAVHGSSEPSEFMMLLCDTQEVMMSMHTQEQRACEFEKIITRIMHKSLQTEVRHWQAILRVQTLQLLLSEINRMMDDSPHRNNYQVILELGTLDALIEDGIDKGTANRVFDNIAN